MSKGFFKDLFIYLKVKVTQREERQRERERSPIRWFTTQLAAVAGAVLIRSQEPGASSWSPTRVQEPKDLGHLLLLSQAIAESSIRSEIAGT